MKVLSRAASPAGFALVLLLFLVLPFISVSCESPGSDSLGITYNGTNLVTGSAPEVPQDLTETYEGLVGEELPGGAPDPGAQVLAILAALVIVFGIGTVLIPHVKARLFGRVAAAGAALVLTVVTLMVAQSNLKSELTDMAQDTGLTDVSEDMPDLETLIDNALGSDTGFWLVVIGLALLLLGNLGAALLGGRILTLNFPGPPAAAAAGEPPTQPAGPAEPPPAAADPLTGQVLSEQPAEPPATPPPATPVDPPAAPPAEPPKL